VASQINASPDVKGPKQICDPNNDLTCATSQTNVLDIIAAHEPKEANTVPGEGR
jgi:hypothetical protein